MNKKLIALALVLLIAVGGLLVAADLPPGTGNVPVTATLKADWKAYLNHGFITAIGSFDYESSKTIMDAFTTDPVFYYGYKTNATGSFEFRMTVSDFTSTIGNTTSTVKIADVKKGTTSMTKETGSNYYKLFERDNSSFTLGDAAVSEDAKITVSPAKAEDTTKGITAAQHVGEGSTAPAGAYTSTVTITVIAIG
ncbi:MAG: hypothetical protein PHS76_07800 [Sphaerochaeta sp.]|nr:hypothetical protein [Sphaerochaeta sp.]